MKTPWHRLLGAWLRGVPGRMHLADIRREAIYANPNLALRRAFGPHDTALIMFAAVLNVRSSAERLDLYRKLVCEKIAPGGRLRRQLGGDITNA